MPSNTLSAATTITSPAQDLAEAVAHFPNIVPGSPNPSSPSPINVFARTPLPTGTFGQPISVSSCAPSPGTVPWLPLTVFSCQPSPYMPTDPCPTPEKGVD
jgi:hypothetical protein